MQEFTHEQIQMIHDASMDILQSTGIKFNESEALAIFKQHGVKVDGEVVYLKEADILKALETTPTRFVLQARNPENDVTIGDGNFVFVPGYGAPFMATTDGKRREGVMEDYNNFCKLIQTSEYLDVNGFLMIEPSDEPSGLAHLNMLYSNMVLCDKAYLGCPTSRQGAIDTLEMAGILWEGKENIRNKPCLLANITTLSPLQFAGEMAASLIEYARLGQPCAIVALIMAGFTGPVTMAGVLTLQNAEILAGITLTQLVNPGTPIIYGSTSSPIDMKSGVVSIGAPEMSRFVSATAQMARLYLRPEDIITNESKGFDMLQDVTLNLNKKETELLFIKAVRYGWKYEEVKKRIIEMVKRRIKSQKCDQRSLKPGTQDLCDDIAKLSKKLESRQHNLMELANHNPNKLEYLCLKAEMLISQLRFFIKLKKDSQMDGVIK